MKQEQGPRFDLIDGGGFHIEKKYLDQLRALDGEAVSKIEHYAELEANTDTRVAGQQERDFYVRWYEHGQDLIQYGQTHELRGLEQRLKRGLDPAGMLAVRDTRPHIESIARSLGVSIAEVEKLTDALHTGGVWESAEDLAKAQKPEVRIWMLLADLCKETNSAELTPASYYEDSKRIIDALHEAQISDPDTQRALEQAVHNIVDAAKKKFVKKDGVPFSEEDAFLHMAIAGERFGVSKDGDLYFVGAAELDYTLLTQEGLEEVKNSDPNRPNVVLFKRGDDVVAKRLYPGFAIVFKDEALALRLAKTAEQEKA